MTGTVFSIEEFAVFDGPGIRTSVFLKGCPLDCSWCHNPEGKSAKPEIVKSPNGCVECGCCEHYAVNENGKTVYTEESIKNCPMSLLRISGDVYTADELCSKLLKNERILKNGGGITFSGGEPLMQYEFVISCIEILKGRLHTAVQTSGYCKPEIFEKVLSKADYFLYDLKLADDDKHKRYTGVSNKWIHQNYASLAKSGVDFVTRIPLIPGVVDTEENITGLCEIMKQNGVNYAELLPYNTMAGSKYKLSGKEFKPDYDHTAKYNPRIEIFDSYNIKTKMM